MDESYYVDVTKPLPNVTFISAISSNHYYEGQNMVVVLATRFPEIQIIVYDLGLMPEHKKWFQVRLPLNITSLLLECV